MNHYIKTSLFVVVAISLATFVNYASGAGLPWRGPTANPPGNNTPAPINVSAEAQEKVGGLLLNTGGAQNALIIPSGRVGIGLLSPGGAYILDVAGKVNALNLCIAGDCRSAWPTEIQTSESIRIVRGVVDGTGSVVQGSGFSSRRDSLGHYTITFGQSFIAIPTVTVSTGQVGGQVCSAGLGSLSGQANTTNFNVQITCIVPFSSTFKISENDRAFSFIAIGSK